MNYKIKLFAFFTSIIFCTLIHATTGGAEKIEVLGYDNIEHKIYFKRNYYDESARPPTLYYFALNQKNRNIPIEVKSIYKNIRNHDFQIQNIIIEKEIDRIKKRLTPLTKLNTAQAHIHLIKRHREDGHYWLNAKELNITKFTQDYRISHQEYNSENLTSVSFTTPTIRILSMYHIPNAKNIQLATLEYLGIPTEFGYMIEDAVLLHSK